MRRGAQLALPLADKRWRERRERWVAPGVLFSGDRYAVDIVDDPIAKAFVCRHHYSGSYVASRLAIGLYGPGPALVGVAVFSIGIQHERAARKYAGVVGRACVELGRFVCDPSVAYNGESWFLARAFPLVAAEKDVRAVVSYADPMERHTAAGVLTKPAHWGTIYQATNAWHLGRAGKRTVLVAHDGWIVNGRALTKIRKEEKGWQYAARQLLAHGASDRRPHESLGTWLDRVASTFRRMRHPGNLVYAFALDDAQRRTMRAIHGNGLPYPKRHAA